MKEALFYKKRENDEDKVQCYLCAHHCVIANGRRGRCRVRENRDGVLYSLVYGKLCTLNVDPIEKKPLFHFHPRSSSLSIATEGCNFCCHHCQNYSISQMPSEHGGEINGFEATPGMVVEAALRNGSLSISYTYTEPTIFMEFALECAQYAKTRGVKNVFVSNGFMTPESAGAIAPYLDADNIDLKGDDEFYKKICGGRVGPVKDTIKFMHEKGVWIEVTTLIIPDLNDSDSILTDIAEFIASVSPAIPWHVTQFHGSYMLNDKPRTPIDTLRKAIRIGKAAGLKFVYSGNVYDEGGENTYCPSCKALLIEREWFDIRRNIITQGKCPKCSTAIEGIWD